MYGFIYIWYDRKHKRFYIGSHAGTFEDGYICSSSWMKKAYLRRPNDFKRKILSVITTNRTDLLNEEQRFLDKIFDEELGKKYYNLKKKAAGGFSEAAWKKGVEASRLQRKNNPEVAEKIRQKISKALQKPWSEKRRNAANGNYKRRMKIEFNDIVFSTIEEAMLYTGKARSTIDRWCNNDNNTEWRKTYNEC